MQFGGIDWRRWQWLRIAPHLNDTLLLAAAIALAAMSAQYPFVQGWLTAKLLALLAYIALGRVALGKEGSPRRRAPRSGRRCWWWATSSPWRSRGRPAWACYSANRGRTKRKTSRSCARRSHPPARCCRCWLADVAPDDAATFSTPGFHWPSEGRCRAPSQHCLGAAVVGNRPRHRRSAGRHLAWFEVPRYLRRSDAPLPRTPSGKFLERQRRDVALSVGWRAGRRAARRVDRAIGGRWDGGPGARRLAVRSSGRRAGSGERHSASV